MSRIEYDGFLASGAGVLAPAIRFDSRRLSFGGQGSWTVFESGNTVLQGTAAAAWLARASGAWRLELSGSTGISQYADEPLEGHFLIGGRVHAFAATTGGWLGLTTGAASGDREGMPVEAVVAGWSVFNRVSLVGSVTGTVHGSLRYVDLLGALRWTASRVLLEARAGLRPYFQDVEIPSDEQEGGYGEVTAAISLTPSLALTLSGGSYPSDAVRRVLGATYISAGLQLRTFARPRRAVPGYTTGILKGRAVPIEEVAPRLEVEGTGELRTLRVHAAGARSVELMGDFTDWLSVRLVERTTGVWETSIPIPQGVHRVNLRVDGGDWVVPGGARVERNEFGGVVGVIVVK